MVTPAFLLDFGARAAHASENSCSRVGTNGARTRAASPPWLHACGAAASAIVLHHTTRRVRRCGSGSAYTLQPGLRSAAVPLHNNNDALLSQIWVIAKATVLEGLVLVTKVALVGCVGVSLCRPTTLGRGVVVVVVIVPLF
jgi:hypothetical protein